MFMKPPKGTFSTPSAEKTDGMASSKPTKAQVCDALGIDPNDPNVTVRVIGADPGEGFDRVLRAVLGGADDVLGTPTQDQDDTLTEILFDVSEEVKRATNKHAPMVSPHEGASVIREEFDELWDEIKADRGLMLSARKEAIQLAAMAVRYVLNLDPR